VHAPRIPEHSQCQNRVNHTHRLRSRIPVTRRVEQRQRERRKEEGDTEPGEEGTFRGEPDFRLDLACVRAEFLKTVVGGARGGAVVPGLCAGRGLFERYGSNQFPLA
jgi:hypothetical protein